MFRSDPAATASRIDRLAAYLDAEVLTPSRCGAGEFVCASQEDCRASVGAKSAFYAGQLPHVGRHYDLTEDGRPLRVVFIGQEQGHKPGLVTLDARSAMLAESGLLRRYRSDENYPARNPHMKGTTQALRLLFGSGVGGDHDDEFLDVGDGQRAHLFDCFALLNSMLCSAVRPNSRNGQSTRTMRESCLRHLRATLEVLEPTVVVIQGTGVAGWTAELFAVQRQVSETVAEVELAGRRMTLCTFTHPAAYGRHNWGNSLDAPYLRLVVEHGIADARRLASMR